VNGNDIFIDTNILIYHTFEDFETEKHQTVTATFEQLQQQHARFYISSQIVREFVAIVTNGKIFRTPLQPDDVIVKINEFQQSFTILFDTEHSFEVLKRLIARHAIIKAHIHDANIAATVIANHLDALWTYNTKDFVQFTELQLLAFPA